MGRVSLEDLCASFSLDVFGMLKCMLHMETGYVARILRLGRIASRNHPVLLPAKPEKSIAATHLFILNQKLSFGISDKNS